ncbi:MAG TPA: hypothetical protein VK255_01595 [Patescibacteria group bacterium]|nr:hypothetical protein [Patescibacteria group bacterium]
MTDETQVPMDPTPAEPEVPSTEGDGGTPAEKCPHCGRHEAEQEEMDQLNLAILIALVPALTITLFSNLGLF